MVGIDPSSVASKFRVPTANSSFHSTATSNDFDRSGNPFCGSGSQTIVLAPTALRNPRILGDGYAYTTYVTYDSSTTMSEAAQPFPVAAYDYFDLLRQHRGDSQFDDALRDLEALGQLTGGTYDTLRSALQNGDRTTAIQYENTMVPDFLHLCNESNTVAIRLHILRVGSDGPSSDIVVREWNYTDSKVYAPTPGDPYDFTPMHMENGVPLIWPALPNAVHHGDSAVSGENWAHMTPALEQQNIDMIRGAYQSLTKKKCACPK